ncbi:hypothetical protein MN116_006371 [Schistosoma mekongi]|uniref:Antistasin-like domain-containing protein n=1 Tax=Schistosoma mekongi TaxID=38744 RepID=A0AAE1ZAT1_SCHME|nr:hypothetical protein MN116_006371 [Schistosoma mekongi]
MILFSLFLIVHWITSILSVNNERDNYHSEKNHVNNDEHRYPHHSHHNHQLHHHHHHHPHEYHDNRLESERRYDNQLRHNEYHHYHHPQDVQHRLGWSYHSEGSKHTPINEGDYRVVTPQHQQNERQPMKTDYKEKKLIPPKSTPAEPNSPTRQNVDEKNYRLPVQQKAPTGPVNERESPNRQKDMETSKGKLQEQRNKLPEKNDYYRQQRQNQYQPEPKRHGEQAENKSTEHRSNSKSPTENINKYSSKFPKPVTLLRGTSMVQSSPTTENTQHTEESNHRTQPHQTSNHPNLGNDRQPKSPPPEFKKPGTSLESYKESSEHKYPTHQPHKSNNNEKLTNVNGQRSSEESNQHPKNIIEESFSKTDAHKTKIKIDEDNRSLNSHPTISVSFVSGTTKYDSPKLIESKLSSTNTAISSESLKVIKSEIEKALHDDLKKIVLNLQKTKNEENKKQPSTPSPKPTLPPSEPSPPIHRNDENVDKHYESNQHGIPQRYHDEDYERKPRNVRPHHEWDHPARHDDEHEPRQPEERGQRPEKYEPRPPFRHRDIPQPHHHHSLPSHHPFSPKHEDESRNSPPIQSFLYQRHIRLSHELDKRDHEMPYESHPPSKNSPSPPNHGENNFRNSYQSKSPPRNQQKPTSIIQSVSSTINGTHQLIGKDYTTILDTVSIPLSINIDDYSSTGCPFTPCNRECKGSLYKLNITTGCPTCQCCDEVKCTKLCTQGYEADDYGCPTCKCLAPIASYY